MSLITIGFNQVNGVAQYEKECVLRGRRLRKARAAKYGLSVPQFRSMKLRPGQSPLGWQIREARKAS